jgi:pimeloyl-ACP methyl ester carboxylesterase
VEEIELGLDGGGVLHVYDTAPSGDERLAVFWHHGTPNVGAPPAPLFPAAERLGLRWVSYDRPGYGGSTPAEGRDVASAAGYVARVAGALGIDRLGVMGHSGGGPHALACGALLGDRVVGVVSVAGLAPYGAEGLDWFEGMAASGVASLRAAAEGREAKERFEAAGHQYDPEFTARDIAMLMGAWAWFGSVVGAATVQGAGGLIDDDLAVVAPWGFDPAQVGAPTLLVHGDRDRVVPAAHAGWLAGRCPSAELWLRPGDGHISVLAAAEDALDWLAAAARPAAG